MTADVLRVVATLAVGVVTGIVSAMFGIGGGVVSKPLIRGIGATPLQTVGSTIPAIIPSAFSGTLRYRQEGLVRWRLVAVIGGTGAVFAVLGAILTEVVPGEGRVQILAVTAIVAWTALRVARGGDDPYLHPEAIDEHLAVHASVERLAVTGIAAGLLNGLLGLGGGVVIVPILITWIRVPVKITIATSLACVGIIAVPGTVTHAVLGNIAWEYAIPLAVGVVPGARLGARLAIRASERSLRLAVALLLGVVAVVTAVAELRALL